MAGTFDIFLLKKNVVQWSTMWNDVPPQRGDLEPISLLLKKHVIKTHWRNAFINKFVALSNVFSLIYLLPRIQHFLACNITIYIIYTQIRRRVDAIKYVGYFLGCGMWPSGPGQNVVAFILLHKSRTFIIVGLHT